jgi:hypothetical protein
MSVRDWKFHDFDMLLNGIVKEYRERVRYCVAHKLTRLAPGCSCIIYRGSDNDESKNWTRKTVSHGGKGSTRYIVYDNLADAMDAAIKWARRKDEEHASNNTKKEETS